MSARNPSQREVAESPLAWLRNRRDKTGAPLVDDAAFTAGERLRADFALAAMGPRTTMDWEGLGSRVDASPRPGGVTGGEGPMAARARLAAALAAVGPDFAAILVDVCCHDKGLGPLERERDWPLRSAKVVLRLALAALARHYGLVATAAGARPVRQWGTPDFRPRA
jgi:hypothetical protein